VRMARFLLQMSERMGMIGQSWRRFLLRMARRDIASHLGVANETISRSFTLLASCGCVRVDNREVEIIDLELLRQIASSTRSVPEWLNAFRGRRPGCGLAARRSKMQGRRLHPARPGKAGPSARCRSAPCLCMRGSAP